MLQRRVPLLVLALSVTLCFSAGASAKGRRAAGDKAADDATARNDAASTAVNESDIPLVAVLPPATKKRARRKQARQADAIKKSLLKALQAAFAENLGPTVVDGAKNKKEKARRRQKSARQKKKALTALVARTQATHALDLQLFGKGRKTKLKVELVDLRHEQKILQSLTVVVGRGKNKAWVRKVLSAFEPTFRDLMPAPEPEPVLEPEPPPAIPEPVANETTSADGSGQGAAGQGEGGEDGSGQDDSGPEEDSGFAFSTFAFAGAGLTAALTLAIAAGAAGVGAWAWADSTAYVNGAATDPRLRDTSLNKALAADGLYIAAGVALLVTAALIATGGTLFLIE